MPTPRHLRTAPIAEALLDIRVKGANDFDPISFLTLEQELQLILPKKQEHRLTKFEVHVPPSQAPIIEDQGLQGIFFKSEDDKDIAQFRIDGFTINRLAPYTRWEDILSRAQHLWPLYVRVARPLEITRLALRYINRIPLPGGEELTMYMRVPLGVPPELPPNISDLFYRITIHDVELAAHVTQSFEVRGPDATWLLDIDAFREGPWEPDNPSIYETLDHLRDFKNRIFFNLLTEAAIQRFE